MHLNSVVILLCISLLRFGNSHCGGEKESKKANRHLDRSHVHECNTQRDLVFDTDGGSSCDGPQLSSYFVTTVPPMRDQNNGNIYVSGILNVTQEITYGTTVTVYYYICNDAQFKDCDTDVKYLYEERNLCDELAGTDVEVLEGVLRATKDLPKSCPITVRTYNEINKKLPNENVGNLYRETCHEYWMIVMKFQKNGMDIYCQVLPVHVYPKTKHLWHVG